MTEGVINTAYLEKRLGVFDDSQEISDMLSGMDCYVTHEGAAHIDGLYVLAQEMMKHIKKLEKKEMTYWTVLVLTIFVDGQQMQSRLLFPSMKACGDASAVILSRLR